MKKLYGIAYAIALTSTLFFTSCNNELPLEKSDASGKNESLEDANESAKLQFSKALAGALNETEVRSFLKENSLKKYDGDYDILYSMVRDVALPSGRTFGQILKKYDQSNQADSWIENAPLLTIFVPDITHFSAEKWDVASDVPNVVTASDKAKVNVGKYQAFENDGKQYEIDYKIAPDIPVIVVKDNERIISKSKSPQARLKEETFIEQKSSKVIFENNSHNYYFIGDSDPKVSDKNARQALQNDVAWDVRTSYGLESQRDWVYYWLTPTNQSEPQAGVLLPQYYEYLRGFKVNGFDAMKIISQDFTEGNFEFHVNFSLIYREGNMQTDLKVVPCNLSDLMSVTSSGTVYKEFNPNLELLPWDMERYGDEWTFTVLEYNPSTTTTTTISAQSTFGWNFEIGFPIKKIGIKFGLNGSTQKSNSQVVQVTTASTQLGTCRFRWADPIITGTWGNTSTSNWGYNTLSHSTGLVELSIEPVAKWPAPVRD